MPLTIIQLISLEIQRWATLLIIVFFCGIALPTKAEVLTIQPGTRQINLVTAVEAYKDASGKETIKEILQPTAQSQFERPSSNKDSELNFGFTDATYWIKITLKRAPTADENWILEIPYLNLNSVTFYAPDLQPLRVGTDYSSASKPIFYPLYALPLQLKPEAQTYYLQVKSQYALTVPLTLWNRPGFSREFSDKLLSQALYFGGLLALALYNFLLFLSLKDRSYLYYTLFALTLGMGMFSGNGYGRLYLWPSANGWDTVAQTTFFSLTGTLSLWFTRSFLRTSDKMPKLDMWLKFLATAYLLAAVLLVVSTLKTISPTVLFQFVLAITIPATLCCLVATIRAYQSKNRSALYLLVASGALWTGAIVAALRAFDLLPSNVITLYAFQIGSCLEMLLLSFALAHRIHTEREQRILAQDAALDARNQMLKLARETET
ncbi:MAG: 7TMR-DISM family protein [Fluviibacter sp.]